MAENKLIESLIDNIYQDLEKGNILNQGLYVDNGDVKDIVSKVVMVIKEHFIDHGLEKVYPYSMEKVGIKDPLSGLSEKALRVCLKGDSIELDRIPEVIRSDFKVKMLKLSESLFNQYRHSSNIYLTIKCGYKESGMKKSIDLKLRKTLRPIDLMDSGFVMQIPYYGPELY